jgi:flagellar hook-length control protein FliK
MSTAAVAKPAEPQRPANASPHGKAAADKPAETDLFASLLSLVSDTQLTPDTAAAPADAAAQDTLAQDPQAQNPLTALLAWATPVAPPTASTTSTNHTSPTAATTAAVGATLTGSTAAAGADAAALAAKAPPSTGTGVDITGMTPVVDEKLATAAVDLSAPASPAARPAFATPAARPAFASRAEAPAQGSTPAMVWQRGAVSSTDALQQQFTSQSIQHPNPAALTPVRSTVALDDRFNLTNAMVAQTTAPREADVEFTLPGHVGLRTATADTGPGAGGIAVGDGAAAGDSTGGSTGDGLPGEPSGSAHEGTRADREADGPTVSHWGTQNLRHASLRVGESGADAIDIQLSMKGQEVQVAFQSDNADARASLREGANDALADLLQRSGIQLGHVSVGSQGQQHGGNAPHTPTVNRGELAGRAEATTPAPATPPRPRADGSRPLDLFV